MLARASTAITFAAFFTATKVGKTGLTITVDVYRGGAKVVTDGGAPNLVEEGGGIYSYTMAALDTGTPGNYYAVFKTADTSVDMKQLPSLWIVAQEWVEKIDAAVSSRNATAPPTAAAIADATWDEALSGHTTAGTAGKTLSTAGAAADPWLSEVPGDYVAPEAGYYFGRLALNQVSIVATFDPQTLEMRYRYGDGYTAATGRATRFTTTQTLTGGAVNWNVRTRAGLVIVPCAIIDANTYELGPTAAQILSLGVGKWQYDLEMVPLGSEPITEIAGSVIVTMDVR